MGFCFIIASKNLFFCLEKEKGFPGESFKRTELILEDVIDG